MGGLIAKSDLYTLHGTGLHVASLVPSMVLTKLLTVAVVPLMVIVPSSDKDVLGLDSFYFIYSFNIQK